MVVFLLIDFNGSRPGKGAMAIESDVCIKS
jgi:hypothetical protein